MTLKKRGLGKGLDALLSNSHAASKKHTEEVVVVDKKEELIHLDLDLLQPGKYQPRKDMHWKNLPIPSVIKALFSRL